MSYYRLMKRVPLLISIILLLCFSAGPQSPLDPGVVKDGTYSNADLGFSFTYPKGWVVHGEATKERILEIGREKIAESGAAPKPAVEVALKNTYQLLTVFRHPLGTPGITFNPALMVMAEKVAHAPGITNGRDYLLNVRTVLLKTGSQLLHKDLIECRFAGSQFFRDDLATEVNGVHMVQTSFATLEKGYALVFIFLGQDQASVDEMAKSMETFDVVLPVRKGVTKTGSTPQRKPD